jgi:hypothetical protein
MIKSPANLPLCGLPAHCWGFMSAPVAPEAATATGAALKNIFPPRLQREICGTITRRLSLHA